MVGWALLRYAHRRARPGELLVAESQVLARQGVVVAPDHALALEALRGLDLGWVAVTVVAGHPGTGVLRRDQGCGGAEASTAVRLVSRGRREMTMSAASTAIRLAGIQMMSPPIC
jgi:hypothetical protein